MTGRELAVAELLSNALRSNREIAEQVGVEHHLVGRARDTLERTGAIPVFRARGGRRTGAARATAGPLRRMLLDAVAETGSVMDEVSVGEKDPFRLETPNNMRDGAWLAGQVVEILGDRRIHLRGLHYVLVSSLVAKPDGSRYANTDDDWEWMQDAAKAARWLGHLPFSQIEDARNAPPIVRMFAAAEPGWSIDGDPFVSQPRIKLPLDIDPDVYLPEIKPTGFEALQRYRLAIIGEKSSLEPVLAPIAEQFEADLYLPAGEMTDTMIYRLASAAAADGRPTAIFYLSDCDPSGWQMPITLGRKLHALKVLKFEALDYELHHVALKPEQVIDLGLPSTPLKEEEKRAEDWRAAFGVDQTEIDSLATLQPEVLRDLVRDAVAPYYDVTLRARVEDARDAWREDAELRLAERVDADAVVQALLGRAAECREAVRPRLDAMRRDAAEINAAIADGADEIEEALEAAIADFELPAPVVPSAEPPGGGPEPLVASSESFVEQTRRLVARKTYADGDDP